MCRTTPRRAWRAYRELEPASFGSRPTPARASGWRSFRPRARQGHRRLHRHERQQPIPSMRRSRSRGPACSMSSARWSMTIFRSMQAACGISRSSCRKDRCSRPRYPAAVAAGNVETSQTIVNCLYGALGGARLGARHHEQSHLRQCAAPILRDGLLRCAGRPRLRRCGGGADAYDQFAAHRPGGARAPLSRCCSSASRSGAALAARANGAPATGRFASSDFLERMECAILSGFRRMRPFGLGGGEPGEAGANFVRRKDGRWRAWTLARRVLDPGDAVIIRTPTGGGYGPAE